MTTSTAELRAMLRQGYDDSDLDAFCQDNFPPVYSNFSRGLRKDEKITMLLDYCSRRSGELDRLDSLLRPSIDATKELPADSRGTPSVVPQTLPIEIRSRYAVLIGVSTYTDPRYSNLPHTNSDVIDLDRVLQASGYLTRVLHGKQVDNSLKPTRANILGELASMAENTGAGDLLLVHFGGHGVLSNNRAYLIASDTRGSALSQTAIDLEEFQKTIANANAQARILFLDACHSGIGRDAPVMTTEFERYVYLQAAGMAVLASCRQGQVAYEHDQSPNGAFTYFVLDGLKGNACQPGSRFITFDTLKTYVMFGVKKWAIGQGLQQWPNATTRLDGDPPLIELKQALPGQ